MSPARTRIQSRFLLITALAASQSACSRGESTGAPPADVAEAPTPVVTVPQGSALTFVIGESVVAGQHPVGHRFTSTLASSVAGLDGGVALPEGTVGRWVVSGSTTDDGQGQALLAVRLEEVHLGGRWHRVHATITSAELDVDSRDSKGETAGKIAVGAVAGAVTGRILGGGSRGAVKGAAVGAAMGTVVALATRGGSATLREGSRITVRLDDQLVLGE